MKVLITGGAGFIGRWLVKRNLEDGNKVWILDDLSNGRIENIQEFMENPNLVEFIKGDIKDIPVLDKLFTNKFDICYHLGASINVQDSIDNPSRTFENDGIGTFNVLEQCKKTNTKMVFMSTCMVYDRAVNPEGISEEHPIKPASPYAGSKIAGENMVMSYWHAYKLPVVVIRPFNTYGPFQKTNSEGGVVSIFIQKNLWGEDINIYGEGTQTRDLLYVEDCVDFIVRAGISDKADGNIINAGTGRDVTINELAGLICNNPEKIKHVPHIHPQSEIQKLLCNSSKANRILDWESKTSLEQGIKLTEKWLKNNFKIC